MPKWMLDLRSWGHLSREEYEEIQNRKLRRFLTEQLYPFSPYYRKFFDEHKIDPREIRTTDDLRHIPFSSKADIAPTLGTLDEMRRPRKFILQPDEELIRRHWPKTRLLGLLGSRLLKGKGAVEEQLLWEYWPLQTTATTGRTALPTSFNFTKRDLETFMEIGRRSFQLAKAPRKLIVVNTFPPVAHLGFWSSVWFTYATGVYCLHLGGPLVGTKRTLAALFVSEAQGLGATPSYARFLFRKLLEEGIELPHLTRLGTGGERMSPGMREELHKLMKEINGGKETFVASTYGFTEAKEAWFECFETTRGWEENTGFHLYPDLGFIELVNPQTGERVAEGEEGEIVYTPLDWRGTCVLRYRTGDVCKEGLTWEPCPQCGRTAPRLGPTIRRRSDLKEFNFTNIKSTVVDTGAFFPILMALPEVLEWQVEARKEEGDRYGRDELVIHLAILPGVDPEALKEKIARLIHDETEVSPDAFEIHPLEELEKRLGLETKLKEDRFIDTRPKD